MLMNSLLLHCVEHLLLVGGFAVATSRETGRLLCGRLLSAGFEVSGQLDTGAFCKSFVVSVKPVPWLPPEGVNASLAKTVCKL